MSVLWSILAGIGTVLLFLLKGVGILLLVVLVVQILCTTVLLFRFSSALRRAGPVLPEGPGI